MNVIIGQHENKSVRLNLDILMRTRLLIQADSGGGKSWLLRRLAEELFGKVQVILVDPEGEFATLREKFGYVLVGKGGETATDPRSAALVAHRLLELRASAICDIYELKHKQRHEWVRLFLEALTDIPKNLWGRQVVIIVDEAHMFCPEKGKGESEAYGAMVDLCTRGRKRGFCAVFATQRLGQLSKDASSQLQNRLIGPTFEDINRKRAAEVLGVLKTEERQFFKEIQLLEPGNFFALGRAISTERILVSVGEVGTTHPEMGSTKQIAAPPPTPEKIKALLPKLADLPKEAEEKQRTVESLKAEIRYLKHQVKDKPVVSGLIPDKKQIERLLAAETARWEKVADDMKRQHDRILKPYRDFVSSLTPWLKRFGEIPELVMPKTQPYTGRISDSPSGPSLVDRSPALVFPPRKTLEVNVNGELTKPEQRILDGIAWLNSIGIEEPEQPAVAFLAGYRFGGGAYNNPRGALRTKGLVEYIGSNKIKLTADGASKANEPATPLTNFGLHNMVMERLPGPEQKLLKPLLEAYPQALTNEQLAEASGYTNGSGGYNNPRGRLRTLGLIEYQSGNKVRAKDLLFPEGL